MLGHPEPATVIEGQVERLVDGRLRRDELDFEARWQMDGLALVFRRARWKRRDVLDRSGILGADDSRQNPRDHSDEKPVAGKALKVHCKSPELSVVSCHLSVVSCPWKRSAEP